MRDIKNLRGHYNDERVFIIGNGPSLNKTPLEKLKSEYTIGLNSIGWIYSETDWRPTIYCNGKRYPRAHWPNGDYSIISKNIKLADFCFFDPNWRGILGEQKNVFYLDKWKLQTGPFHKYNIKKIKSISNRQLYNFWSDDISDLIYHYHTMYEAVQIAVYLGFDAIYFIGCDLGLEYLSPHLIFESGLDPFHFDGSKYDYLKTAIRERSLGRSLINGIALNLIRRISNNKMINYFNTDTSDHFIPDYLTVDIADGPQTERELIKSHIVSKRVCENKGINIYNATIGGELEVYDRVDLNELI
ncbi:hypothetical protein [Haloquadratum walsbyi]|nr:hypothetical protein [Haloquadratum walsbyi]